MFNLCKLRSLFDAITSSIDDVFKKNLVDRKGSSGDIDDRNRSEIIGKQGRVQRGGHQQNAEILFSSNLWKKFILSIMMQEITNKQNNTQNALNLIIIKEH